MTNVSEFFYRDSFYTKKHNETDKTSNKKKIEMDVLQINKNINNINIDNISQKSKNSSISNKSDSSNINNKNYYEDEEIELFSAEVETINPIEENINNTAIYNIKIKSSLNYNDTWIKSYTLDDFINFREYLLKYISPVINLPFPTKSLLRFLPYIGYKYDERNWDILLENKFLLDDFLKTICKDKEMYKLSGFINFFSKPETKRNSNNLFFN